MQRQALGRGLSALLGTPEVETDRLREIEIEQILPNAHQPRKSFDEEGLNELAESIRAHGVVQPIVVRPLQDGFFQLIAGERRWRASQRAGLTKIPAVVRESDRRARSTGVATGVRFVRPGCTRRCGGSDRRAQRADRVRAILEHAG